MAGVRASDGTPAVERTPRFPLDGRAYANYVRTYAYDRGGNLTQVRHSGPATGNGYTVRITVADRNNRAVPEALCATPGEVGAWFDAGGHPLSLRPGGGLGWSRRGALARVILAARDAQSDAEWYGYDGDGMRILKTNACKTAGGWRKQRVVYLPGLELRDVLSGGVTTEMMQAVAVGAPGDARIRWLHWEVGGPDGIGNDQLRYLYDDPIGNGQLELDGNGEVISREEYYPYGGTAVWTTRGDAEADYKTIRYACRERDATGLYYYGYRYYQPWMGRWLSADPAGEAGGVNLYRMARNNPVTFGDAGGTVPIPKQIHFAWEGRDISADNLSNMLLLNWTAPEYEVNVWTTRPMSVAATLERMRDSERNPVHRHLAHHFAGRLKINDTKALYRELVGAHAGGVKAEAMFYRELNGPYRNYAAASDITRAALMYLKGGVYMDADVFTLSLEALDAEDGFLIPERRDAGLSNAVLASVAGSEKAGRMIQLMVDTARDMDDYRDSDGATRLLTWTTKRSDENEENFFGRLKGTVMATGPGMLRGLAEEGEGHRIPERLFGHREYNYQSYVGRRPVERDVNAIFTGGIKGGFDGRGAWNKLKNIRRASIG